MFRLRPSPEIREDRDLTPRRVRPSSRSWSNRTAWPPGRSFGGVIGNSPRRGPAASSPFGLAAARRDLLQKANRAVAGREHNRAVRSPGGTAELGVEAVGPALTAGPPVIATLFKFVVPSANPIDWPSGETNGPDQ